MRKSVYLRDKMDDDILEVIKPLLKNHSFAHVMRELARDGIKYRKGEGGVVYPKVIQSVTPVESAPIQDIKLVKKEASDKDIASRLDNF
ncbi:hypothetical protein BCB4_0132 [Bacillus phage B4]|uniref:Uncharacterized protein n=2 Tax=Bequatrovirus B4 TaxID=1918005 RepID=J9PQU3_9CAUD|nr:hypothetical protein BCB4_0132 [Bacillus phage B4]YP_009783724.1 hypothetical protein QLX26_gp128 [Bacillus phage B5S]MEB9013986.1 hypothetical protein [Bacillus cereus]AEW47362.1 hypothetical protein B5S_0128 [Bacillus phage B5S]AEZ65925.1 hypothetical protein BCB4_0132 [Bacillus phage B4]MEB9190667.1 hypothetical protein [Bacillus cereus]